MKPAWLAIALSAALLPQALAVTPGEERRERERIASERAQVQALYAQRERECQQKFIVTACLEEARRTRREALERLRREDVLLDEAQRRQRARQRMEDISSKVSAGPSPTRGRTGEPARVRWNAWVVAPASAAR